MTPHQLFAFAQSEIPSVTFHYYAIEDYEQEAILLKADLNLLAQWQAHKNFTASSKLNTSPAAWIVLEMNVFCSL